MSSRDTGAVCSDAAVKAMMIQPVINAISPPPIRSTSIGNSTFVRDRRSVTSRSIASTAQKISHIERKSSR